MPGLRPLAACTAEIYAEQSPMRAAAGHANEDVGFWTGNGCRVTPQNAELLRG